MKQKGFTGMLDDYFSITERGGRFSTEVLGGIVTFMAMAYILVVQPSIMYMGGQGMPREAVFTATAIIAGVSTIAMGLYARLPFALAPGMGSNAIVAGLVTSGLATWQQGLGMIVISGIIFMLTSFPIARPLCLLGCRDRKVLDFSLRKIVVEAIPLSIKLGVGFNIGMQLAILGAGNGGMKFAAVVNNRFEMGDLSNPAVIIGLAGLVLIMAMAFLQKKNGRPLVPGAYLIGMLLVTVIAMVAGIAKPPAALVQTPPSVEPVLWAFDLKGALKIAFIPYVLVFFMSDFFSTTGTALSCAAKAGLMDEQGNIPRIDEVFRVDSLFTLIGAFFGLTTVTTFVESSAGVESGAKSGLASVVTGCLFLAALFLSPVFLMVPPMATGAALFAVGIGMMTVVERIVAQVQGDRVELVSVMALIAAYGLFRNTASAMCFGIVLNTLLRCLRFTYYRPEGWRFNATRFISSTVLFLMGVSYFAVQIMAK